MSYSKKTFVDNQTVIDAATLNAMQDTIIANENAVGTATSNITKMSYTSTSSTWKGLTCNWAKFGRLAIVRINGTTNAAISSSDGLSYPTGYKSLGTGNDYKLIGYNHVANVNATNGSGITFSNVRTLADSTTLASIPANTSINFMKVYITTDSGN